MCKILSKIKNDSEFVFWTIVCIRAKKNIVRADSNK